MSVKTMILYAIFFCKVRYVGTTYSSALLPALMLVQWDFQEKIHRFQRSHVALLSSSKYHVEIASCYKLAR